MIATNIYFTHERNGYNQAEVDRYIATIRDEYQKAFDENRDVVKKYNSLLDDCRALEVQERTKLNSDIIAKTVVSAEVLAQKIVADAHTDALAVNEELKLAVADANSEIEKAKAEAQKIIDDAKNEANLILVRAKRNLEQAHKTMGHTANEVQRLLTFHMPEPAGALVAG